MLKSKTIDRICCIALAAMLLLTCVMWAAKACVGKRTRIPMGYERLFDQSTVHAIDIEMADWDGFIAAATQENYWECAVTIDGEKISNVGIRGKGNTSLSSVAGMGSQKYSFKIEFNQFVKGRSYRGLDKLSLNNLIYDATMMKDYLAYTLMGRMDVPSPLCSFVQVSVNGEPWGLYLAVEGVEDGFLERNNMTAGELYKPDSMSFGGGRGNGRDFDFERFRVQEENVTSDEGAGAAPAEGDGQGFGDSFGGSSGASAQEEGFAPSDGGSASQGDFSPSSGEPAENDGFGSSGGSSAQAPEDGASSAAGGDGNAAPRGFAGGFNFGMGSSDVKLQYIDDDPDSYANIFDNAKTKIVRKDQTRLIDALKTLNGEDAREAVYTDEVIRYLAVHNFLCNDDSYTGTIVHNYYLYEENGRLAIIPWDYNLAFGAQSMGFGSSGATSLINSPIDSPVSNGDVSDRPLVAWIFSQDDARMQYHEIYGQFLADVIESGWLKDEISRVAEMIRPCVEADENSFYTVEAFDAGIQALQSYCALRGQSIRGQLNGTIPSTTASQRNSTALLDAGDLSISAMGAMNMGGRMGMAFTPSGGENGAFPGSPGGQADPFSGSSGNAAGGAEAGGNSFGGSAGGPASPSDQATPPPDSPQPSPRSTPAEQAEAASAAPAAEPAETARPARETGEPGERGGRSFPLDGPQAEQQSQDTTGRWLLAGGLSLLGLLAILLVFRVKGHNSN